jgi:hypothetical protein
MKRLTSHRQQFPRSGLILSRCLMPPLITIFVVVLVLWLIGVVLLHQPPHEFACHISIALGVICVHIVVEHSLRDLHHIRRP